jgi:2-C-methyl-D-erythritol 4-phosphate cytidylyltransferase
VTAALVVLAGGSGSRFGAGADRVSADRVNAGRVNKVYLPLAGRPVISWSLRLAIEVDDVGPVVLVARPEDGAAATAAVAAAELDRPVQIVAGGATRHGSELAALDALADRVAAGEVDVVAVHDGARPLAGADLLRRVLLGAVEHGGAVPTVPVEGVWRRDAFGGLVPPGDGPGLHRVQTPQAFRAGPLLEAYARSRVTGFEGTDTAATLERFAPGLRVVAVPGHAANLKVTFGQDLDLAERLLADLRGQHT